jgi:hypothetical protein
MANAQKLLLAYGHALVSTQISTAGKTVITDALSVWQTPSNAFDGITAQTAAQAAAANGNGVAPVGTNYVGIWLGTGNRRIVRKIILTGPSNNSLMIGGGATVTVSFDGSNDGSAWTSLDSFTTSGANSQVITRTTATIVAVTAYEYFRVSAPGNGANGCGIAEIQFFEDL